MKQDWKWYGLPGHFIGGANCVFHMLTHVGNYMVSTVGDYRPVKPGKPIEIGLNRYYETLIFRVGKKTCGCGCGQPSPQSWSEIDMAGYNDPAAATAGHLAMCEKYDALAPEAEIQKTKREKEGE